MVRSDCMVCIKFCMLDSVSIYLICIVSMFSFSILLCFHYGFFSLFSIVADTFRNPFTSQSPLSIIFHLQISLPWTVSLFSSRTTKNLPGKIFPVPIKCLFSVQITASRLIMHLPIFPFPIILLNPSRKYKMLKNICGSSRRNGEQPRRGCICSLKAAWALAKLMN